MSGMGHGLETCVMVHTVYTQCIPSSCRYRQAQGVARFGRYYITGYNSSRYLVGVLLRTASRCHHNVCLFCRGCTGTRYVRVI